MKTATNQNRLSWIFVSLEGKLMGNSKLIGSVFLVGMSMILCAETLACICAPCPSCHTLISGWPTCDCEYECDPLYCETCIDGSCASWCDPAYCDQRCIAGVCAHCNGDSDKVCCDGDCEPKCDIIDGESCEDPDPPGEYEEYCQTCVIGDECLAAEKIWTGVTEKICSPEGCPGDCVQDTTLCWELYDCVPDTEYAWFLMCGMSQLGSIGCNIIAPTKCYGCKESDTPLDDHYVDADSCN